MSRFGISIGMALFLGGVASVPLSHAADTTVPATPSASAPAVSAPAPDSSAQPSKSRIAKGKRPREKEIEGTEARDRFQADTVLKSKYHLDGEQLEVDPD